MLQNVQRVVEILVMRAALVKEYGAHLRKLRATVGVEIWLCGPMGSSGFNKLWSPENQD